MQTRVVKEIGDLPEAVASRVEPPEGFGLVLTGEVEVDGETVWHLRFERDADSRGVNLGGEHYSALVTPGGVLKGETLMDASLSEEISEGKLPDEEQAREVALRYLERVVPDLAESIELRWIAPHHEKVFITSEEVAGGLAVTVAGMKVKCKSKADGRYFWVIVGPGGRVITFERDVVWNAAGSMRQTEMWLHDLWLCHRGEASGPPS